MMRMAGSLLIIGATSLVGIERAERLKSQYEHMKYLQRIICLLQSEIRYSRSFLGEIFYQIAQGAKEPYRSWLLDMSEKTGLYMGESFEAIWKRSIDEYLGVVHFPAYELESLKSLGNQIGYADVQVQIRLLDLYLTHLEKTMQEIQEEMRAKTRIYHCLGVMSGVLISVLLF